MVRVRHLAIVAAAFCLLAPVASHADQYNSQSNQLYQATGQSNPVARFVQKYVPSGGTTIDQDYRNAGGNPDGNSENSNNSGDDQQ